MKGPNDKGKRVKKKAGRAERPLKKERPDPERRTTKVANQTGGKSAMCRRGMPL